VAVWRSTEDLDGLLDTDGDVLVARSVDNGANWSAPEALNTNAASDSGFDEGPRVITDGAGHWVAVWTSDDDLGGTVDNDDDLFVSRSTDNGVTWSAPAPLNANAAWDHAMDSYHLTNTDGAGYWVTVWACQDVLGGRFGTDLDILVARSTDNGATWSFPAALNTNAFRDSSLDEAPWIAVDGAGHWMVVWHSENDLGGTIATDRDILMARFTLPGRGCGAGVCGAGAFLFATLSLFSLWGMKRARRRI
jgi:Neuraminidase (sialidase)